MGRGCEEEEGAWAVERGGHQRTLARRAGGGGHNKVNGDSTNGKRRDGGAV